MQIVEQSSSNTRRYNYSLTIQLQPISVADGLERKSTVYRLLGSRVRIPSWAQMFVCCECCVLSGTGLWDGADPSYRGVRPSVYVLVRSDAKITLYTNRGAGKSLARPTSRWILFYGENISFDVVLLYIYIYIYSTNIPPIMIINRIYESQNLLSL
jgi:hypothetical protein